MHRMCVCVMCVCFRIKGISVSHALTMLKNSTFLINAILLSLRSVRYVSQSIRINESVNGVYIGCVSFTHIPKLQAAKLRSILLFEDGFCFLVDKNVRFQIADISFTA